MWTLDLIAIVLVPALIVLAMSFTRLKANI